MRLRRGGTIEVDIFNLSMNCEPCVRLGYGPEGECVLLDPSEVDHIVVQLEYAARTSMQWAAAAAREDAVRAMQAKESKA